MGGSVKVILVKVVLVTPVQESNQVWLRCNSSVRPVGGEDGTSQPNGSLYPSFVEYYSKKYDYDTSLS